MSYHIQDTQDCRQTHGCGVVSLSTQSMLIILKCGGWICIDLYGSRATRSDQKLTRVGKVGSRRIYHVFMSSCIWITCNSRAQVIVEDCTTARTFVMYSWIRYLSLNYHSGSEY